MKDLIATLISLVRNAHAPVIVLPSPDGDGEAHYSRDGEKWTAVQRVGPRVRVVEHGFTDIGDFCAFVSSRYADAPCDVLVDGQNLRITCNTRPHEHHHDLITCAISRHPAASAWLGMAAWHTQQEVVEHLRGFGAFIIDDGGAAKLLGLFAQLNLTSRGEWKSEVDHIGRVVVQAASKGETMNVRLPETIRCRLPWFQGVEVDGVEPMYAAEFMVSMERNDKGQPVFRLSLPERPLLEQDALGGVVECVTQATAGVHGIQIGRGKASTATVPKLG